MNKNYKLVALIILMLLLLTMVLSIVNYKTTFALVHNQIKKQSLPLALDNIYTDIQKQIIEPYLISSMMANDTFVKEWLLNDGDAKKIEKYLHSIKKEYKLLSAILVQDKTKNYYTQNGFLEKLYPQNRDNKWYFKLKNSPKTREINIDTNVKIDKSLIMFMNNKILDKNGTLIGITSTGVKIDSINKMLEMFKRKYHLEVYLFDNDGDIILTQKKQQSINSINEIEEFKNHRETLLKKESNMFQYESNHEKFIVNTKYIPELDLHILVKAKLSDFTGSIKSTFYFTLLISLFTTLIVALVIIYIIKSSLLKLEKSNEQKNILLKEVHHRVKNNLNLTASMLGLQAISESDEISLHLLKSKSRIEAIATVHEMLYKQNNFTQINFYNYVSRLEALIISMISTNEKPTLIIDATKELVLPLDIMVQFGLMINEMFTNTIKYAKNQNGLEIVISLSYTNKSYLFKYKDNGNESLDMERLTNSKGLGSKLIWLSVKQLNGTFKRYYDNGLCYEVTF